MRATRAAKPSGSGHRGETECSELFIVRNARKATTKCLRSRLTRSGDIGTAALSFLGTITGKLSSSAAALKFCRLSMGTFPPGPRKGICVEVAVGTGVGHRVLLIGLGLACSRVRAIQAGSDRSIKYQYSRRTAQRHPIPGRTGGVYGHALGGVRSAAPAHYQVLVAALDSILKDAGVDTDLAALATQAPAASGIGEVAGKPAAMPGGFWARAVLQPGTALSCAPYRHISRSRAPISIRAAPPVQGASPTEVGAAWKIRVNKPRISSGRKRERGART